LHGTDQVQSLGESLEALELGTGGLAGDPEVGGGACGADDSEGAEEIGKVFGGNEAANREPDEVICRTHLFAKFNSPLGIGREIGGVDGVGEYCDFVLRDGF